MVQEEIALVKFCCNAAVAVSQYNWTIFPSSISVHLTFKLTLSPIYTTFELKSHIFFQIFFYPIIPQCSTIWAWKEAEVAFGSFRRPVLLNLDWNDALGIKSHLSVLGMWLGHWCGCRWGHIVPQLTAWRRGLCSSPTTREHDTVFKVRKGRNAPREAGRTVRIKTRAPESKFDSGALIFQCVMKPTPAFVRVNATLRFVRLNAMAWLHLLLQMKNLKNLRKRYWQTKERLVF